MLAKQNNTVDRINSPDINTNIPAVKVIAVKMSLVKFFDLRILPPKRTVAIDKYSIAVNPIPSPIIQPSLMA